MNHETYAIDWSKVAIRAMRSLSKNIRNNIDFKVSALAVDPTANNNNVMPLHGVPGFRLRVGDWRVLYEVDHPQRRLRVRRVVRRGEDYKP